MKMYENIKNNAHVIVSIGILGISIGNLLIRTKKKLDAERMKKNNTSSLNMEQQKKLEDTITVYSDLHEGVVVEPRDGDGSRIWTNDYSGYNSRFSFEESADEFTQFVREELKNRYNEGLVTSSDITKAMKSFITDMDMATKRMTELSKVMKPYETTDVEYYFEDDNPFVDSIGYVGVVDDRPETKKEDEGSFYTLKSLYKKAPANTRIAETIRYDQERKMFVISGRAGSHDISLSQEAMETIEEYGVTNKSNIFYGLFLFNNTEFLFKIILNKKNVKGKT